jgi:hypothetical protein
LDPDAVRMDLVGRILIFYSFEFSTKLRLRPVTFYASVRKIFLNIFLGPPASSAEVKISFQNKGWVSKKSEFYIDFKNIT